MLRDFKIYFRLYGASAFKWPFLYFLKLIVYFVSIFIYFKNKDYEYSPDSFYRKKTNLKEQKAKKQYTILTHGTHN